LSKYNEENKITEKTSFKYDDKGNMIESTRYDANNKIIEEMAFKYDDKNNLIESLKGTPNNKVMDGMGYKYDDNGNLLEQTEYKVTQGKKDRIKETPTTQIGWEYVFYPQPQK
jgi:YD repeat-containing protein